MEKETAEKVAETVRIIDALEIKRDYIEQAKDAYYENKDGSEEDQTMEKSLEDEENRLEELIREKREELGEF